MNVQPSRKKQPLTLRDLHPEWTDEQCEKAEETLDRYLEVVVRIANRIFADPEAYARFRALTASRSRTYDESPGNPFPPVPPEVHNRSIPA